jgi:predicted secreted protein
MQSRIGRSEVMARHYDDLPTGYSVFAAIYAKLEESARMARDVEALMLDDGPVDPARELGMTWRKLDAMARGDV